MFLFVGYRYVSEEGDWYGVFKIIRSQYRRLTYGTDKLPSCVAGALQIIDLPVFQSIVPIGSMVVLLPTFAWCIAHLGNDGNWWIKEVSEDRNWDFEVPSLLSPDQTKSVLEQSEKELGTYGISADDWNKAFYRFRIDKRLNDGCIRLVRTVERLKSGELPKGAEENKEEPLFALPDEVEEECHPYVDFLDKLIKARTALLNERINFVRKLSTDEVREILDDAHRSLYFECASLHVFREISDILNYVPSGFELRDV